MIVQLLLKGMGYAVVPCHHLVWYDAVDLSDGSLRAVVPCHHLVWYDRDPDGGIHARRCSSLSSLGMV